MFRPFIATCDKRLPTFRRFVKSYLEVEQCLAKPIVYYSGDNQEYLELLALLEPHTLIEQPKHRDFQENICYDLPSITTSQYPNERILFLEDDILFSSKFREAITIVENRMIEYPFVHLVTMYGNGNCYWPPTDKNFMYRFSGHEYYGNLCLAIQPKVLNWWNENATKVFEYPVWGWDIKIGQQFEINKFNWYCTKKHYVQHQIGPSAIDGVKKEVQSNLFVP